MANLPPLPSNSNRAKFQEEKSKAKEDEKIEPVVTGKVKVRKKGLGKQIAETFKGEDVNSVASYLMFDVIIPNVKSTMYDLVAEGFHRLLFGEIRRTPRQIGRPGGSPNGYVSYGASSRPGPVGPSRSISSKARETHDFGEIILASREEAENVIDRMCDLIDQYDVATVADLYKLLDVTPKYTDDKFGWVNKVDFGYHRVREGYILQLPSPIVID